MNVIMEIQKKLFMTKLEETQELTNKWNGAETFYGQ